MDRDSQTSDGQIKFGQVSDLTPKPPSRNGKGDIAVSLAKLKLHDLPSPIED